MSDYLGWPAGLNTADLRVRTRRPKLSFYGPPRGSAESQALFGASKYSATAQQMANRAQFKFSGAGRYGRTRMTGRRRIRRLRSSGMRLKGGRGGYFDNFLNFGTISQGTGHAGNLSAGMGDYTVPGLGTVDNAIVGAGYSSAGIPQFAPHQSTGVFSKVEFLQNIFAPTTAGQFQNTVLPLNPGLQQTFPWLALVAPQFEEYEFLQLMFYWRPMVSDFNSGTGQTGEIVMVTQYNPADPPFIDTLRAKSYDMAMSCKASLAMNHGVECDPTKNSGAAGKYVRTGPLYNEGVGSDLKQYDLGNLNVIVTGTPSEYSGQLLGELWVAYTVALRKPKLPVSTGDVILRDWFQSTDIIPDVTNTALGTSVNLFADWPSRPIGYGGQNRINPYGSGVTISSPQPYALYFDYTVPTWYSGDLEITFTAMPRRKPDIFNPGPQIAYNPPITATVSGDVEKIQDMPEGRIVSASFPTPPVSSPMAQGVTDVTWIRRSSTVIATQVGSTDGGAWTDTLSATAHVRFLSTNNPSTRYVRFILAGDTYSASADSLLGWTLNAGEYNTSFNIGGGGAVGLVANDGTPIVNPFVLSKPFIAW